MATHLRVLSAFGDYQVGDTITDPAAVETLMERRDVVVPIAVPEPPPPPAEHGEG